MERHRRRPRGDDKEEVAVYSTTTVNIYAASQFDYTQPAPTPGKPFKQTKFTTYYDTIRRRL